MIPNLLLLIPALMSIESGCNSKAVGDNGRAFGCLQIRQCVVDDCNRVQGVFRFEHSDAFDAHKSQCMFLIYIGHYATGERLGHQPTLEDAALIWHAGPDGWRNPSPEACDYWQRAERLMR
jgi:hypothetical protein